MQVDPECDRETDNNKCQRKQHQVEPLVVVEANCVADEGAMMVKHQHALAQCPTMLRPEWLRNVACVTESLNYQIGGCVRGTKATQRNTEHDELK